MARVGKKNKKPEQYHTIPVAAFRELGKLYAKGAAKYDDPYNFHLGYPMSLSFDALMRHLFQFWGGEDWDTEVIEEQVWNTHHAAAVVWHGLNMLMQSLDPETYGEYDDRPHKQVARENAGEDT